MEWFRNLAIIAFLTGASIGVEGCAASQNPDTRWNSNPKYTTSEAQSKTAEKKEKDLRVSTRLVNPHIRLNKNWKLKNLDELVVYTYKPHYAALISRKKGEKDLQKLTKTKSIEEGWLFVKYCEGLEIFYENGIGESKFGFNDIDKSILRELKKDKDKICEISFYHFHPLVRTGSIDMSQTPSATDMKGYVKLAKILKTKYPKLSDNADFRIVTSTGTYIITYDSDKLWDEEAMEKTEKSIADLDIEVNNISRGESSFDYGRLNYKYFHWLNKGIARTFSKGIFKIRFEEF